MLYGEGMEWSGERARQEGRGQTWVEEKFPPAAAKKQKLLPKIARSRTREEERMDSHKGGPKVLCLFFGMQLREGG